MRTKLEIRKIVTSDWFKFLQNQICEEFEQIEKGKSRSKNQKPLKKLLGKNQKILWMAAALMQF